MTNIYINVRTSCLYSTVSHAPIATHGTEIAAQQPRLAVEAHVQAGDERGHDEEGDADVVEADPEVGQLARVAEQGVVRGGQAEAGGAGRQVDVEDGAVGDGGAGIAAREVHGERGVAGRGDGDARDEVRVDVAALVVQVGPAAEAGAGGGEDGPVARPDVRVLAVPRGHLFDGEQGARDDAPDRLLAGVACRGEAPRGIAGERGERRG